VVGSQGSLTPGDALDIIPIQKEGSYNPAGDYLYREMKLRRYLEGGLWGILRVHDQPKKQLLSLPDRLPKAPINVRKGTRSNTILWDVFDSKDIVGFNVYRKAVPEKSFTKVNKVLVSSHSFTDADILTSSTYVYSIRAVDKYGNESMSSKEIIVDLSGRKTKVSQKKDVVQSGQTESTEIYELTEDVEISTEEYPRFAQSFQLTKIEG
jgi:hypothetical protein